MVHALRPRIMVEVNGVYKLRDKVVDWWGQENMFFKK